ncbi:hypothetical protein PCH_Pc13g10020 [Penicillium rubens Wisconsin 54-1255]|uniref:Uncharacterized protein n=1 Tax=Penicillium rubens (strain ATCC 28089 / DSM 1075 / NRRL 1951 / Wisconsin 54-1255) TaxID=500485 RepID=B6H4Q2_PENRW|nr:hypothetical protein PCH_Pc13g10020 [Penicillium rubens Wisconsin 54-1255]
MDAKIPCNYHTGVQYDYLGMYPEQASLALLALNDTCIHNTNLPRLEVEVKSGRGPQSDPPRLPRFTVRSFHPWIHLCPANWLKFSTDRVCVPATFGTKFGIRGKIHHSPLAYALKNRGDIKPTTPAILVGSSRWVTIVLPEYSCSTLEYATYVEPVEQHLAATWTRKPGLQIHYQVNRVPHGHTNVERTVLNAEYSCRIYKLRIGNRLDG